VAAVRAIAILQAALPDVLAERWGLEALAWLRCDVRCRGSPTPPF
jgi:hypothetical protein